LFYSQGEEFVFNVITILYSW